MPSSLSINNRAMTCVRLCIFLSIAIQGGLSCSAQDAGTGSVGLVSDKEIHVVRTGITYEENKNQWPGVVQYKADLPGARLFLEKNAFTFVCENREDLHQAHEKKVHHGKYSGKKGEEEEIVHAHAYKVSFQNASEEVRLSASDRQEGYTSYFIGNDRAHWASEVYRYKEVNYLGLYPGINMHIYSSGANMKYDLLLEPGADAALIRVQYEGLDGIRLEKGRLVLETSVGNLVEEKPVAWQVVNGIRKDVSCSYVLNGTLLSFDFPQGYDKHHALVIDPVLVASTYSGSTADTWGVNATYDKQGNIFGGGYCHGQGYPATTGAFQVNFSSVSDIAISKYDPTGSHLIWASYLGGNNDDMSFSFFCNSNNELYVAGKTMSTDFPVTPNAYDPTYKGGYDVVVTHFNFTGTSLLGSTYIGGSTGDDGSFYTTSTQIFTEISGELVVDAAGNACVATTTSSSDFPVTPGAYQQTFHGGGTDACVFQLSPDMHTLLWSTYLGGSGTDGASGLKLTPSGDVFVSGATASPDFPVSAGAYQQTSQGGQDAFIMHLSPNASGMVASTLYGTPQPDNADFIDLDRFGNPYIYGITNGGFPVTPGTFNIPGTRAYVAEFKTGLNQLLYSTQLFGPLADSATDNIYPTAFMVDSCENVYLAGFEFLSGVNDTNPLTPNAQFHFGLGDHFYVMLLNTNSAQQIYSSYYEGDHTHGTGRFSPLGVYYQICCDDGSIIPNPGAWSSVFSPGNYDPAAFKVDLQNTNCHEPVAPPVPPPAACLQFTTDQIPNVFTPNGDGKNDTFYPFGTRLYTPDQITGMTAQYSLLIYDRWGVNVFDSDSYSKAWNGNDKHGAPVSEGVYYWILNWKSNCPGTSPKTLKGFVQVQR